MMMTKEGHLKVTLIVTNACMQLSRIRSHLQQSSQMITTYNVGSQMYHCQKYTMTYKNQ